MNALPLIVIELVLVFGGALAFAWWQLRDLARERRKRADAQREDPAREQPPATPRATGAPDEAQ